MAKHVGHAWLQPCREYTTLDGEVKGICAISSEEASELLEKYVEIELAKKNGPVTDGIGGPVIGSYTLERTSDGIVVHGQLNSPIEINAPHNMSISTD